ncbi:MAG: hypothetical protein ACI8UD_004348, partial [Planctomycetota bacterium]
SSCFCLPVAAAGSMAGMRGMTGSVEVFARE